MQIKHELGGTRASISRSSSSISQASPNSMYVKSKTKYSIKIRSSTPTERYSDRSTSSPHITTLTIMEKNKSLGSVDFPIIVKCYSQVKESQSSDFRENAESYVSNEKTDELSDNFDDAPSVELAELDPGAQGVEIELSDMDIE